MAYDYLGLVNDVNRRLNEVELTQSNFSSAIGFYAQIKDGVNASINKINQEQFEWPFNHVTQEDTLVPGTIRYSFQSGSKTVDMDSFRIKRDDTLGVSTKKLRIMTYEEFLSKYSDSEYNSNSLSTPTYVVRTPSLEYIVYPSPDKEYTVVYEYYSIPSQLVLATDVPSIPEQFRFTLVDGAMYHAYLFRGDLNSAELSYQKYVDGIKDMRTLLVNRYEYARSTVNVRGNTYAF